MKTFIAFFFSAFFAGASLAQDQIQNQPQQPQAPPQGWYKQNSGNTGGLTHVFFKDADSGWATVDRFSLYTTNGGNSWQPYTNGIGVLAFIGSFGYGNTTKGDGWFTATTDGGQHWIDYNTGFDNAKYFYFCTLSRGYCFELFNGRQHIARTEDGGKSWIADLSDTVGDILSFVCFDSLHTIAGGGNYPDPNPPHAFGTGIFYTSDGGVKWKFTQKAPTPNSEIKPVLAFDTASVYFLGGSRGIYKSRNRGYTLEDLPIKFAGEGLAASDSNNITGVGHSGDIYRTYDGGKNWVKQNSGTTVDLYAVSFVDSATGWAVGDAGTILHTTNAGYSWVKQQIPQPLDVKVNPEPFATKTTITYSLPHAEKVDVKVYDVMGKEVYHIQSQEIQSAGFHSFEITADGLSAGIYTFLLVAGGFTGMGKMTKIVP